MPRFTVHFFLNCIFISAQHIHSQLRHGLLSLACGQLIVPVPAMSDNSSDSIPTSDISISDMEELEEQANWLCFFWHYSPLLIFTTPLTVTDCRWGIYQAQAAQMIRTHIPTLDQLQSQGLDQLQSQSLLWRYHRPAKGLSSAACFTCVFCFHWRFR